MSCLAYGEPMPISGSQARETPNFTSALVMGSPFWKRSPFFKVNVQVLPPSEGVPVSVARSGRIAVPPLPGAAPWVVRVR